MRSVSSELGPGEFSGNAAIGFTLEHVIFSIKTEIRFIPECHQPALPPVGLISQPHFWLQAALFPGNLDRK